MREAAGLRGHLIGVDQPGERIENRRTVSTESDAGFTPITASPQP